MKLSTSVCLATTAASVGAFAPLALRSSSSHTVLRVSNDAKATAAASTPLDLAADFDDVGPEDVLAGDAASGAKTGQAEVVLVGCGAPNRGMGWYHAVQMLEGR